MFISKFGFSDTNNFNSSLTFLSEISLEIIKWFWDNFVKMMHRQPKKKYIYLFSKSLKSFAKNIEITYCHYVL